MKKLQYTQSRVDCNLCGGTEFTDISYHDRHDLSITSAVCKQCGVISINPRMSSNDYETLYQSGENHRLWMELNNTAKTPDFLERYNAAYTLGLMVAEAVRSHVGSGLVVEVGSGTGGVLAAFRDALGVGQVKGIDPSPEEAELAESHGVPTFVKSFESCTLGDIQPETVMSSQSLNHLYDPRAFLTWAHNILPASGTLVLVVLDFIALAHKLCSVERATQIDHIYMFTPDSLKLYATSAGFDVVGFKKGFPTPLHMTLVAKKTLKQPFKDVKLDSSSAKQVLSLLSALRRKCFWVGQKRKLRGMFKKPIYSLFVRA